MSNLDHLWGFRVVFGNPRGVALHLDGCSDHRHENVNSPPSANKKRNYQKINSVEKNIKPRDKTMIMLWVGRKKNKTC